MIIKRGGIYLAALDPVIGREIANKRPVLVVSSNINNKFSGTITVVPLTSGNTEKIYPFEVFLHKGMAGLPSPQKSKPIKSVPSTEAELSNSWGLWKKKQWIRSTKRSNVIWIWIKGLTWPDPVCRLV